MNSDQTKSKLSPNIKKKTIRKKSPQKLSIKQNLILEKLKLFYEDKNNIKQLLDVVNSNSKVSLRIIDWFVTNYSKKKFVVIPVKKELYIMGDKIGNKTKKRSTKIVEEDINIFLNYKAQLKAFSKKQFDPFCRRERISFKYNDKDSIITTVGQLNFFKWAIENDILLYIKNHLSEIEEDMNTNIKKPGSKKKRSHKKTSDKGATNLGKNRKKRRELSTSAVKSLNKHGGKIVLSFD